MRSSFAITIFVVAVLLLQILSCKKERSCERCNTNNQPPIAIAGPDQQIILPIDSLILNGTASYDPDGRISTWQWTKLSGPTSFQVTKPDSAKTITKSLVQGTYQFVLKVTDDKGATAADTVIIIVHPAGTANLPPVACAGNDQSITLPVNSVQLDGSCSSDPDNNIATYSWTKISGPTSFAIVNTGMAQTQLTNLTEGTYLIELKITDAGGLSSMDTVQIMVQPVGTPNQPPVACAGQDQTIMLPTNTAVLNGSCSTDPNNNITAYQWTKISGPSIFNIQNPNAVQTQVNNLIEGIYLFTIKVTDAGGLFSFDTVKITVSDTSSVEIFIAGGDGIQAKYWHNGQEVILPGGPQNNIATSIAVYNNDVYVSGEDGDPGFVDASDRAKYWKNGQEIFLPQSGGAGATSIAVSNGDIYIAGWQYNIPTAMRMAVFWKNGQFFNLTDGSAYSHASCIFVDGNNVYISGEENYEAKYWKNGQVVSLTNGTSSSAANSITVVGSDVYVAGYASSRAVYWKNGQQIALTNALPSSATSIAVVGNDVYVAGYEGGINSTVAKCWKNGQEIPLNQSGNSMASSIAVFEGDVYVTGGATGSNSLPAYWKNGQVVLLSNIPGSHSGGIVVRRR